MCKCHPNERRRHFTPQSFSSQYGGMSAPASEVRAAAVSSGDDLVVALVDFFTMPTEELEPVDEMELGGEG
jgi:hypothetical protein